MLGSEGSFFMVLRDCNLRFSQGLDRTVQDLLGLTNLFFFNLFATSKHCGLHTTYYELYRNLSRDLVVILQPRYTVITD